jgi:pimeloyl-ACP methyl ester carboxylesterase
MKDPASAATQPKPKVIFRWLRKISLLISGLALVLITTGTVYQAIEAKGDGRRFRQEGRLVDVGGYRLNINCAGQGSPTVILESGLEVPAIGWRFVQPEVAKFTRVCSYDRAGYGWSDPGLLPRTSTQIVRELHTLLKNAGEKPPYLLVGHSFGGINVRIYNGLYPTEVTGMVLVEAPHEDLKLSASIQKFADADLRRRQRDRELSRLYFLLGISRFIAREKIGNPAVSLDAQEWCYFRTQPKFIDATTSEMENLKEDMKELRAAGTLGDKPLIVLTAGKGMFGLPLTSQDWVDLRNMWVDDFQVRLAHLSSRGKRIMVPDSGHFIPYERPATVVSAVRKISMVLDKKGNRPMRDTQKVEE